VLPLLLVASMGVPLVIGLMVSLLGSRGRRRLVPRVFWCPIRDRSVATEIQIDAWTLRPIDVRSCSAFDPPERVLCHKRCRDLPMAAPAARR
jgi:hypothetical protein